MGPLLFVDACKQKPPSQDKKYSSDGCYGTEYSEAGEAQYIKASAKKENAKKEKEG